MRLTNGDINNKPETLSMFNGIQGTIWNCRNVSKDQNASLTPEQSDLLSDLLLADNTKADEEIFSDVLNDYVKGKVDNIKDLYQINQNRRQILEDVAYIKQGLDADSTEILVGDMFKSFSGNKDQISEASKQIMKDMMKGEDEDSLKGRMLKAKIKNVMEYIRKVFGIQANEQDVNPDAEGKNKGGCGKEDGTAQMLMDSKVNPTQVTKKQLQNMLEIAGKLNFTIHKATKEKVSCSKYPDNDLSISVAQGMEDAKLILPHQFIYDEVGLLQYKIFKKELMKKQYLSRQKRKQCTYLLLDSSGSMKGIRRTALTLVFALIIHSVDMGDKFVLALFDRKIVKEFHIRDKFDAKSCFDDIMGGYYFDGGTDITHAVNHAINVINNSTKEDHFDLRDADIMLVTDGEDCVDVEDINSKLEGSKINIHAVAINEASDGVKRIAKTYCKVTVHDDNAIEKNALDMIKVF